jgi:hypothetical protein
MQPAAETARRALRRIWPDTPTAEPFDVLAGGAVSRLIAERLGDPSPLMVTRLGANELRCVLNYLAIRSGQPRYWPFLRGSSMPHWWHSGVMKSMRVNAGFFPTSADHLAAFAELMLADLPMIDILGSWLPGEALVADRLALAVKVKLSDLEPYYHEAPWTEALAGRRVLVIHPFAASIRAQYEKRHLLFADPRMLPRFDLIVQQAVQSIGGEATGYGSWFEALDTMKQRIGETAFDVALIGCGAYGLPLAAHVKLLGKKAIHLGGALQVIFGIRGQRWEAHPFIQTLMNDHWIRPTLDERPAQFARVEDGCYW